jgi:mRNA interferase RelE/StbE
MFDVVFAPEARDFYANADRPLARKLARCFESLEQTPRSGNNIKKLSGEFSGYLRYRIGDWRVIYRIDDGEKKVVVALIAHRREVYE